MKRYMIVILLVVSLAVGGCAGLSDTGWGAVIGAAAGTAGGYLYGKHKESEQNAYKQGYEAGQKSKQ